MLQRITSLLLHWRFSLLTGLLLVLVAQPILFLLLPIVLFIRMTLNALDGMLARECNQKTRLGAILNETGDVISDIALYLPFYFYRKVTHHS